MVCKVCGYDEEKGTQQFVGIFAPGSNITTTDGELCGLYGCPKYNMVQFTTDVHYIRKRKDEYKQKYRRK